MEVDIIPEVDVFAVADTTLDSAAPIGACTEGSVGLSHEGVVVLAARDLCPAEAGSDLESFGSRDREHCVSKFGLELVKHWLSKPSRHIPDHTSNGATNGVERFLCTNDTL